MSYNEADRTLTSAATPEFCRPGDVRRVFGISRTMIYELMKRGEVKGEMVPTLAGGMMRLIECRSVRRWIRKQAKATGGTRSTRGFKAIIASHAPLHRQERAGGLTSAKIRTTMKMESVANSCPDQTQRISPVPSIRGIGSSVRERRSGTSTCEDSPKHLNALRPTLHAPRSVLERGLAALERLPSERMARAWAASRPVTSRTKGEPDAERPA